MNSTVTPPGWHARRPLIAILRGIEPTEALAHADALLEEGITCIEVPTNSPQWQDSVAAIARHAGSRALVGAGTVWQDAQLQDLIAARGRLMVTPHTGAALIAKARALGLALVTVIGCATATEAFAALHSVLPKDVPIFAVGCVRPDNIAGFMKAGCAGAGLGRELYRAGQTPQQTRDKARAFIDAFTSA